MEVASLKDVQMVRADHCMFDELERGRDGRDVAVQKPSGFMTNSDFLFKALSVTCDRSHEHIRLRGDLPAQARVYPPKLVGQILWGLRAELRAAGRMDALSSGGPTLDEPPPE